MNESRSTRLEVTDKNGVRGVLDLAAIPPEGKHSRQVLVRFREGASVFVPSDALVGIKEGGYFFSESFDEMLLQRAPNAQPQNISLADQTTQPPPQYAAASGATTSEESLVIPMIAEEMQVEKRRVATGGVRIHKTVQERTETIDEPLMEERVEVERIPVNQAVDAPPPVRYEGDVMIVPLLEEIFVVEKRLVLREELRIRKQRVETHKPQTITLRREEAAVERVSYEDDQDAPRERGAGR